MAAPARRIFCALDTTDTGAAADPAGAAREIAASLDGAASDGHAA